MNGGAIPLAGRIPTASSSRRARIDDVAREFPFPGYVEARRYALDSIATHCTTLLRTGARILDYGAGPCETCALLVKLGFNCTAVDDLSDDWHTLGANRERIKDFAKASRVDLIVGDRVPDSLRSGSFDMVMVHDVIEHFADSPRELLLRLIGLLRPGGYLYLSVPNAVNLRKRLLVLSGRTNYPRFPAYYWSEPHWRGHKREYTKNDLGQLCAYLGLKQVLIKGQHHRLNSLPIWSHRLYRATVGCIDSLRETLSLIGQKDSNWQPLELSPSHLQQIRQRETPFRYDKIIACDSSAERLHADG